MIDLEWVERLVRMVEESEIDSLEISRFATRVRISKSPAGAPPGGGAGNAGSGAASIPPPEARPAPASADGGGASAAGGTAGGGEPAAAAEVEKAGEPETDLHEVESPMVGTFFRAPAPDAPAYVEVGDRIEQGQTLCILEAMKLMNELEADVSGTVREVCVENAEPVEYGEVLFRIELDGAG